MTVSIGAPVTDIDELPPDISKRARALLFSLVRPRRFAVIGLGLLVVLAAAAGAIGPVFVARALDQGLPAAVNGDATSLIREVVSFAVIACIGGLASFCSTRFMGITAQKILLDLRQRLFVHVQKLDLAYHEKSSSGRMIARQSSDMESVQQFLGNGIFEAALGLLQMAAIAVVLIFLDVPLALIVFAGFIPLFIVSRRAQVYQRSAYRRTRTSIAKVIVHFTETMGGIRAVQAFRKQPASRATLDVEDRDYELANADALRGMAWFSGLTRLIGNVTQFAIIVVGAWLVVEDYTQVGVVAAFLLYLRRFYNPLDELVQSFNLYQSASAALEKITAVLDTEPQVKEPASPRALPARQDDVIQGRTIDFDDVEFSYVDGVPVLPRFTLNVPAGQTIALVGSTGAGKTTLAKMMTRFYDPTHGAVRLDGVDLRTIANDDLRRAVVMVTQESFLFAGTIADNIRIGNPQATDAQVAQAVRAVGLSDYIDTLDDGLDTDVKKRGGRLSSGQRQLVSFARVFLADPSVIVLDEATAHLDIPSERLVQEALETVLRGRTAVVIAHRLSTVEIADRVIVMERGRLVEDGPPAQLIAGTGRFAALHAAWRNSLA